MNKCILRLNIITTIAVIILIILGIINGEYLRPLFRHSQLLNPFLGSFPNFVGSFILFTIIASSLTKKIVTKNRIGNIKYLLILFGFLVLSFLTIEEYFPFFAGSKTFDTYDIIANCVGVLFAYIFFVFSMNRCLKKNTVKL